MIAYISASLPIQDPLKSQKYILLKRKKKKKLETREFARTSEYRADGAESTAQVSQDEGRTSSRSLREGPMSDSALRKERSFWTFEPGSQHQSACIKDLSSEKPGPQGATL